MKKTKTATKSTSLSRPWASEVLVVRMPPAVKDALEDRARDEDVSMNTVVVEALLGHLAVDLGDDPREHGRPFIGG